ncbi:MAG: HAD family phosphatase [Bacteroidales bacterium]|nr:HAD family phosphatase [Bacteroidales bacterium]
MIKNIIFDLGGVIYDIRYENIADAFEKCGFPHFTDHYTQAAQSGPIDQFEEGNITIPEFRSYIRSLAPVPLTDQQIDDSWNAIIIDVPERRVEMLKQLKEKYQLFLFSNTNQLNYDKFKVDLKKKFGYDIFDELFVKVYFSHEMHMRKPAVEAFQLVIKEQHLNPAETLFIDDTSRHILGAQKAGLNTYLLPKGEDVAEMKWLNE